MSERIRIEITDHVADVVLARPEKRNGLDRAMFEALIDAGSGLADDASVRAVVLRGDGPAFCAGLDFKAFMADPGAAAWLLHRDGVANRAQLAAWTFAQLPVPVIVAIHGVAFGGGLQIALAGDIRFVTPDARMSVMEIEYGLVPDMTATETLAGLVRADIASELVFTGRVVDGTEAVALGLATRVAADPVAEARACASSIAAKSPPAIRAAKRLLRRTTDDALRTRFVAEETEQRALLGTPNQLEAVAARMAKRAPVFE